jgi:hypothetical protein
MLIVASFKMASPGFDLESAAMNTFWLLSEVQVKDEDLILHYGPGCIQKDSHAFETVKYQGQAVSQGECAPKYI